MPIGERKSAPGGEKVSLGISPEISLGMEIVRRSLEERGEKTKEGHAFFTGRAAFRLRREAGRAVSPAMPPWIPLVSSSLSLCSARKAGGEESPSAHGPRQHIPSAPSFCILFSGNRSFGRHCGFRRSKILCSAAVWGVLQIFSLCVHTSKKLILCDF